MAGFVVGKHRIPKSYVIAFKNRDDACVVKHYLTKEYRFTKVNDKNVIMEVLSDRTKVSKRELVLNRDNSADMFAFIYSNNSRVFLVNRVIWVGDNSLRLAATMDMEQLISVDASTLALSFDMLLDNDAAT